MLYIAQKRPQSEGTDDQRRAYQQIKGLLKRNDAVYCLYQENGSIFLVEGEELIWKGRGFIYEQKAGPAYFAKVKSYLFKRYPYHVSKHTFPQIRRIVKHILKEVRFDVIHIHSTMVHNFPDMDRWMEPVIVDYLGAISVSLERRYRWTHQFVEKTAIRGELGRVRKHESFLKECTVNGLVSSHAARRDLAPVTIDTFFVVPNYVEDSFFSCDIKKPKKQAIIFTGPFNRPEYADAATRLVKDIFPLLKAVYPELQCWLGGANAPPAVKKLAEMQGVDLIEDPEEVVEKVKEAAVYICPIRFGFEEKTPVLEAAALGCPVVISQTANESIGFAHEKHAILADLDEQIVERTIAVLENRIKRLLMAGQARIHVYKHYSEKHVINQLVYAYQCVERTIENEQMERLNG